MSTRAALPPDLDGETRRRVACGVRLEGIELYFGRHHVIKDVSLTIEPGEFFTFLGPSGCGKTTLLRLIAGFGEARRGRVLIGGEEVTRLPPWERNVGMVFQSYALWPHMTVRRNVAFGLEERRAPRAEIRRRVEAALELVGLLELAERRPSQLSGGQQQRVALARTVVVEPRVLLLDEPLSNLDAKLRVQMRRELLALQRKLALTTIFVTHDQEEANTTADRIAVLRDGVIQQVGTPTELYDRPANRFVADFLGVANLIEGEVAGGAEGARLVSPEGLELELTPAQLAGLAEPHGACCALLRPQHLRVRRPGEPLEPGEVALAGTVEHREFLGSLVRYAVRIGGHALLVEEAHRRGEPVHPIGAHVEVALATDQAVLLGPDADSDVEAGAASR